METNNIAQHFFEAAKLYPTNDAIIHLDRSIDYQELQLEVEKTAHYFLSKGIKNGDKVLVFVPMSIDLYRIVLALFSIGASAVFLDEWVNKKRLEICCSIAQCSGFIGVTKAHLLRLFSKQLRKIPIKLKINGRSNGTTQLPIIVDKNETALITFTTGSTGTPKAAKRTHHFLDEQLKALKVKVKPSAKDVELTTLPIVLFINLGAGATSVICNFNPKKIKKLNIAETISSIQKHQVQRIVASPYFFKLLCTEVIKNKLSFPHLTQLFTGGAPVFPKEAKHIIHAFPNIQSEVVFGSTEAEPISSISMRELIQLENFALTNGLAVGYPVEQSEVKIIEIEDGLITVDDESELKIVSHGNIGEIIVAGNHVLKEYLNNPEAILRNKIIIGEKVFHRTGDSGFLNEKGQLFLTGRCASIIHAANQTIYPFLIENNIQSITGVEIGTILQKQSKIIIVLEKNNLADQTKIIEQINRLDLPLHELKWMKIPRDQRHHSKVDYETLLQLI